MWDDHREVTGFLTALVKHERSDSTQTDWEGELKVRGRKLQCLPVQSCQKLRGACSSPWSSDPDGEMWAGPSGAPDLHLPAAC